MEGKDVYEGLKVQMENVTSIKNDSFVVNLSLQVRTPSSYLKRKQSSTLKKEMPKTNNFRQFIDFPKLNFIKKANHNGTPFLLRYIF